MNLPRIVILTIILAVSAAFCYGADLSDYPNQFIKNGVFDAVIVIGDNSDVADAIGAVDIATSLQYNSTKRIASGSAKLASEIDDITKINAIVVGGPCANAAAARLMGYPKNCLEGFTRGKALIKLFEFGDKVSMLVAGATALDTRRACRVLANYEDYDLRGSEVEIAGTELTGVVVK